MRASVRRLGAGLALLSMLLGWAAAIPASVRGGTPPPAIHVDPASGPPGQAFTLTGEHLTGGVTYELLICPLGDLAGTPCGYSGANLVGLPSFTALEDGTVPPGTTG